MSHLRLARVLSLLVILAVLWGYLPQPAWAAAPRRAVRPAPLQQGPGGRRQVFRTDFNTPGNLEGWHIMRQPANTSVQVTNGYLQLSTFGDTAAVPRGRAHRHPLAGRGHGDRVALQLAGRRPAGRASASTPG